MRVDKNYCMSSYLTFRYVDPGDIIFKEGVIHKDHALIPDTDKYPCRTAEDIDRYIREQLEQKDLSHAAIFLSGGMDSAILASYMPEGTKAYTVRCVGATAIDETSRARQFCEINGLEHIIVDVTWGDYIRTMDTLMLHDGSPIIPNEPQAYAASKLIAENGGDLVVYGDCADTEFGGMSLLLSVDWDYDGWVQRFSFVDPRKVLKKPVSMDSIFDRYRVGKNGIDFIKFIGGPYAKSAAGALTNAFDTVGLAYIDPYERLKMADPLDLKRVRSGDSKYLIRDLFRIKYPGFIVPEKIPMSRPAEEWMKDWQGPVRKEFIPGCVEHLTGEQKLLVYSLERFLNLIGC